MNGMAQNMAGSNDYGYADKVVAKDRITIAQALDRLHGAVNEGRECVGLLEDAISPVLTSDESLIAVPTEATDPSNSSVLVRLAEIAEAVERTNRVVANLRRRVQL